MSDEVMREILEVLRSIAANTGRSADNAITPETLKAIVGTTQQAQAPQPSNVNVNGGNVFAMRQADASRGMSGPMQRLVYGG
jgi:phage-related minor tail protein